MAFLSIPVQRFWMYERSNEQINELFYGEKYSYTNTGDDSCSSDLTDDCFKVVFTNNIVTNMNALKTDAYEYKYVYDADTEEYSSV